jgi:NitT/TauT family transport system substrate-binding protein
MAQFPNPPTPGASPPAPHRLLKWFLALGLAVLLVVQASGCGRFQELEISVNAWIGFETLFLAQEFNWLPQGVSVREVPMLSDSVRALEEGRVDAAALTLDEMLLARSRGVPLTAVLVFNVSAGADALLAKPIIEDLRDLRGRRVGIERSALGPLVLSSALGSVGMGSADVQVLDIPPNRQLEAWRRDQVDAVVTHAPTTSRLEALGARRLFDSGDMPGMILDVLAVRSDRLDHPALPALVEAHFRALTHLRRSPEDALFRISGRLGEPVTTIRRQLAGILLPDLQRNRAMLSADGEVRGAALALNALMTELGLLPAEDDLRGIADAGLVSDTREHWR